MNRPACFRLSALLLAVLLAASPAFAGGLTPASRTPDLPGLVASFWQGLLDLISFDQGRSTIDPNGDPAPTTDSSGSTGATEGSETDGRSTIDPDGQP